MKILNFPRLLWAAGGLAFGMTSVVSAQSNPAVPNPNYADVLLGFRATSGQGNDVSYIVNLGPVSQFQNASPGSTFTVPGLAGIEADLDATYGTNWETRPDLHWGLVAARPTGSVTVWGSRPRSSPGTPAPAWPTLGTEARASTSTQILSFQEGIGGYRGSISTNNNPAGTLQTNSTSSSSWAKQVGTPGTSDFGSLSQWTSIEANFASGVSSSVLDLYRISSTGVFRVGSFKLTSGGAISFTALPIPPAQDTDGDGFTDVEETVAGTNPNDATDFFRVQSIVPSPGGNQINILTTPNRIYRVRYSPDLSAGSWTVVHTYNAPGSPGGYSWTDTDPVRLSLGKGFYHVSVNQ